MDCNPRSSPGSPGWPRCGGWSRVYRLINPKIAFPWYHPGSSCESMEEGVEPRCRWRTEMRFPCFVLLFVCALMCTSPLLAQSPNGVLNGLVLDPSSGAMVGAEVVAVNDATGVQYTTKTNGEGIYVFPNLPPGPYRLQVSKIGFKTIIKPDIVLNVQDALSINFTLPVGAFHEIVTVEGGAPLVNTESATVSTVVDRQFAENLPMNGRSFQSLIELTPGVVVTTSNGADAGQFSVNGQRASSNYWMLDGVSANTGVSTTLPGNGLGGALGSFSVLGGTNSLVSVDALQEFRVQTSTYAPEFGRSPGAQISILTRSGTNGFHGTAFDYLRNDTLDANNWFNGYTNTPPLPKAKERQNDFGGTFAGPILKNKTFFFFSYEGLRLRLPQTQLTTVPDLSARQNAAAAMQPYLSAFPLPNGKDDLGTRIAQFNASFSDPASLDAYSFRIDHRVGDKIAVFGRYSDSPSEISQRGGGQDSLSTVTRSRVAMKVVTVGATWLPLTTLANDLRFNYSRTNASSNLNLDAFGGAVPLGSLSFPGQYNNQDSQLVFGIFSLTDGYLGDGLLRQTIQRQINLVDNVSIQIGTHALRFGVDFRRLSPISKPFLYSQFPGFNDVSSAETGSLAFSSVEAQTNATFLFRNLSAFAQDTWRALPRLTLTYGLRWDVDAAPSTTSGPRIPGVTGFNLQDLSQLALAPGTPPFNTTYGNFAPRFGIAYQLSQTANWGTVLRGGFGVFYDLATQEVGNLIDQLAYPFGADQFNVGGTFPLSPVVANPPPIAPPNAANRGTLTAFDPHLRLPYALEWNVALEQAIGVQQKLSVSYVGSSGRRLIQSGYMVSPNPNLAAAILVGNSAISNYNALQAQFQRRLSHGFQALISYTWSHSIDDASAGSTGAFSNTFVTGIDPRVSRGPSDFDIRHSISAGLTYDVAPPKFNRLANAILQDWSTDNFLIVRSASPVNAYDSSLGFFNGGLTQIRPDVVPGQSFYLTGPFPGGKAFNLAAFKAPPTDPNTGAPLRQGTLGRNALRGFGATEWDFAVHRDFPIHEALKLQFRAEMFNVLNHPNFGPPVADISQTNFGLSTQMLAQSLGGANVGGGGFSPLYQIGGPRSIQFALKLTF
jgi:hypothetical protein